jgi:nucleotide-binding universal stress UspA family protein
MLNFKNILYAIDLNSEKNSSLKDALQFAQLFKCSVHILYVNDSAAGYRHPTDREDAVALRVKELVDESLLEGMNIIYAVSKGDTAQGIAAYAKENAVDLIIIGHKHRGQLYAALFDSTDVNILDKILVPVLVFPEQ